MQNWGQPDVIPKVEQRVRYVLYARKSSEQDELQALSIDSQINEMLAMAARENLEVVEVRKESHSAKESGQRPVFQAVVADIRTGKFSGIIAWDPSRISRNAGDLGAIVDLMDQKVLIDIRTHGQRFTNSPNEKFLLMILCSQAKLENDHKGENVKRGLRAKCEMGWRPGVAPIGYLHDKYADKGQKRIILDPVRSPIVKQMFERVAYEDLSGRDLSEWLNNEINFTTRTGKRMALSGIYRVLKDTFYYGEFEYPVGSGKFYKGSCDPIIDKELYLRAQANLLAPPRRHPGTVEFEFVGLLRCGSCGSTITAEEKFKRQLNGNVHRYVYYHCTKGKDRYCKEGALREEELLRQITHIIDKIDINEISMQDKIRDEIQRFRKFSCSVLGQDMAVDQKQMQTNIRNYAKYILTEGTKDAKRELLTCLRSKMELKDKMVYLKIDGKE